MRALLLAITLLSATAYADKPEIIDEADFLRVQLAEAQLQIAARVLEDARAVVRGKYRLSDGDQVDPQTRAIKRAQKKPEPKK